MAGMVVMAGIAVVLAQSQNVKARLTEIDHLAQSNSDRPQNINLQKSLKIGFSGTAKLGHWSMVTVTAPAQADAKWIELKAIDGDESPVTYTVPAVTGIFNSADPNARQGTGHRAEASHRPPQLISYQGLCRFGRRYGSLTARLLDEHKNEILSQTIDLKTADVDLISSTDHLTLFWGEKSAFESQLRQTLGADARSSDQHMVRVTSQDLPTSELGWQPVNQLVISVNSKSQIESLKPDTWKALVNWVGSGGRLVVVANPKHVELLNRCPLSKLWSPSAGELGLLSSSRKLERLVGNSKRRLITRKDDGIPFVSLNPVPPRGTVRLSDETGAPLLYRIAEGYGEVNFVAFDLASDRLTSWSSYPTMLEKIFESQLLFPTHNSLPNSDAQPPRGGSAVTHYGYNDLLGQLRVPLDDFSTVRFIDFTVIAILITLYIACISLGDYFLLSRYVKKMEMTWITFPLIALLFSLIAFGVTRATRPSQLQINQMEILDFDLNENYSRGTAWANIYSPYGQTVDITVSPTTALGLDITHSALSWQGLPGAGLAGLETETSTGFKRTGYQQILGDSESSNKESSNKENFLIRQMPLPVSATQSLVSNFKINNPPQINSQLTVQRDRLKGTLTNPFDVPVFNGKVYFGNYVYLLKKPLLPGKTVFLETDSNEKTIRTHLNQRASQGSTSDEKGKTQSRPWDPRDPNLPRIASMMMFYRAAGGANYTGLTHGYFPQIDFSNLLKVGRAVLVGQIESASSLQINGDNAKALYDSTVTMVRVVLPVEEN